MDSIEKIGVVTKKNKKKTTGRKHKKRMEKFEVRSLYLGGGINFFFEKSADEIDIFCVSLPKSKPLLFVALVLQKTVDSIDPESVYMI